MTKDEFVQRRAEFMKRDRRVTSVCFVIFFVLIVAGIWLPPYVPKAYKTAFFIGYFCLFLVNVILMFSSGFNQAKRAGLVCDSCKGGLLNKPGNIAVATGICPHCGKRAFAGDV